MLQWGLIGNVFFYGTILLVLPSEEFQAKSSDDYHSVLNMAGIKSCLNV